MQFSEVGNPNEWSVDALKVGDTFTDEWLNRFRALMEAYNAQREALDSMVRQFGYAGNGKRTTGGLSALEEAFDALGWDDPHPLDADEMCDEPGCKEPIDCGTPTPSGYRRTCSKHCPRTE